LPSCEEEMVPRGRPALWLLAALILVVALVIASSYMAMGGSGTTTFTPQDPAIGSSGSVVTYPSDYAQLAAHVLSLINQAREANGYSPVVLDPEPSAQQHADSMLYYGYFSHWDPQGYKPYMRYTLMNGTGAVFENIAWSHNPTPLFLGTTSAEAELDDLHYEMMYNDAFENWGHRINILDPTHNEVSIGVAFNSTDLYLVEDFENVYGNLTTSYVASSGEVTMAGALAAGVNPAAVQVYYDPPPTPEGAFQLLTVSNFTGPYTPGEYTGEVFPSCSIYCPAPTGNVSISAVTWSATLNLTIQFDLSPFINLFGPGVYTLYLQNSTGTVFTSHSIFVETQ